MMLMTACCGFFLLDGGENEFPVFAYVENRQQTEEGTDFLLEQTLKG